MCVLKLGFRAPAAAEEVTGERNENIQIAPIVSK